MKKFLNFIFWPALAGLVFSVILVQMPHIVSAFPILDAYFKPVEPTPQPIIIESYKNSYSNAIKIAAPAVVSINSQQNLSSFEQAPGSKFPTITDDSLNEVNSLGSGVILSHDGYIITSYHVYSTKGTQQLSQKTTVTLNDGRKFDARYVLRDEANDLVLLKIKAEKLPYMQATSTPEKVEVGDIALVIGNPRNIGQSVSLGIISAFLSRDDSYLIQTDASINPGNSGGALIDANGNLIGISSSIISESGGSEGIGLATPAFKASELLQTYLENGPSGYLGVDGTALTAVDGGKLFGRMIQGLLITGITENSSAEKAGILAGDLITAINGKKLVIHPGEIGSIVSTISDFGPEALVHFEILRKQKTIYISAKLEEGGTNPYGIVFDYPYPEVRNNDK